LTCLSIFLVGGWPLLGAMLAILSAHEMGHFFACRRYGIDATLPYFIPTPWIPIGGGWLPIGPLVGTFGAVIRVNDPFPNRRALFDVGIAGPLAGFLVCLPLLYVGIADAQLAPIASSVAHGESLFFGEPLILRLMTEWIWGAAAHQMTVEIGFVGLAAWFGLLLTSLNLFPIGQLDGGHIVYALVGRKSLLVSRILWWTTLGLIYFSPSWILWVIVTHVIGIRHPPTQDDSLLLDWRRKALSVVALLILVLCFMPDPIPDLWQAIAQGLG
jgi:membrane-associated protease RseP (regulator of RpoE activity)